MKIKKRSWAVAGVFLLSLSIVLVSFAASHASDNVLKDIEITGIVVLDNAIRVTADAPITYKIYRTEDPFRVTVDIERARLGFFSEKMFPDRAWVTEITPVQILKPAIVARLNILLQTPAMITPEVKDNVLLLTIKDDGKADAGVAAGSTKPDAEAVEGNAADDESAASEAEPASAEEIIGLRFSKTADGAALVLKGDGAVPEPEVYKSEGRVIIDITGVETAVPLPPDIALPVKGIRYRTEKEKLRFIIDMESGAKASVAALDDELVVNITSAAANGGKTAAASNGDCRGEDKKQTVSFDVQEADLASVIGILNYDMTGCNIVINPDDVKGKKITMKLSNVPWQQALDIILKTFGLEKIVEGNVIRVVTKSTYQDEHKAVADKAKAEREAKLELEDIEQRVFPVNYADVDKIKDLIDKAKILSPRGNLSTDSRTRSIIVNDVASNIRQIGELVASLDKRTPQVLIEARIVEVTKNFESELGIEWGGYWSPTATKSAFNVAGSVSPSSTSSTSSATSPGSGGLLSVPASFPSLVSLPTPASPTGAFTVGYLNAQRTLGLDVRITALEQSGRGKTVSSPKIMTLDNEKALIKSGRKIPYTVSSANTGPSVAFIDAALTLTVTPHVSPDKTIRLDIQSNNDQADFSNEVQGEPSITENEATTQVLIKDGETVVMGGILSTVESENVDSVPGISKIPILGALFRNNSKSATTDELLIFITPRVIEQ